MRTNEPLGFDPTDVMGRRFAAFTVDSVILIAVFLVALVSLATFEGFENGSMATAICDQYARLDNGDICLDFNNLDDYSYVFVLENDKIAEIGAWVIIASVLNLVIIPAITGGSLGKLAASLRVVKQDTFKKAGFLKHLLRWLLWIVDAFPWLPLLPLTGWIVAETTKGHRRVGDLAARTLVVNKKFVDFPILVPGVNDPSQSSAALSGQSSSPPQSPPTQSPYTQAPYTQSPYAQGPYMQEPFAQKPDAPARAGSGVSGTRDTAPSSRETDARASAADDAGFGARSDHSEPAAATEDAAETAGTSDPAPHLGVTQPAWDAARDTYIQWDRSLEEWMEWDSGKNCWVPISQ